ncbi:MAG: tyrosine-type recombinase/integrase [Butyrivibrio hungatei]|nr:tyrosine-type recombinase/integrase [Butyrivibrio hungatei]
MFEHCYPHMFRRTRATDLYKSDIELELVSRIRGHSSTQTTRIYYDKQAFMESSFVQSA